MNPDRATLNFLNTFPDEAKTKGEELQKAGCVTQIFGNHLFIRGRVELDHGPVLQTSLRLDGNRWVGNSDSPEGEECSGLYATMLERLERGEDLPEAPNEVGEKSIYELLEDGLGREMKEIEEHFVSKVERRYRRYAIEQKIFDHDLVRISPKWEVTSYDALTNLWPVPPADIVEFWNYIAYAFEKKSVKYPDVMAPITDIPATRAKMAAWENEQEVGDWQERVEALNDQPEMPEEKSGAFRMMVTTNEARLQWRADGGEEEVFTGLEKPELAQLVDLHEQGALRLDPTSELLWVHYLAHRQQRGMDEVRLESETNCRFLNHLFNRLRSPIFW